MIRKMLSIYMTLYLVLLGFVPVRTARAQGKKIYTIGVLNLDAKGVSQVEAEVISERLRSHIMQVISSERYRSMEDKDMYEVVERENMDRIFEQFDIQNVGCVSDSCAIEFGKMLQADRICQGTIGKVGNTFSVSTRILDVETTKTIAIADRQAKSIDEVMSTTIIEVGNDLLYGRKKKSKLKWFLLAGAVAAAGAGAALMGGGDGDGGGTPEPAQLPQPPSRP